MHACWSKSLFDWHNRKTQLNPEGVQITKCNQNYEVLLRRSKTWEAVGTFSSSCIRQLSIKVSGYLSTHLNLRSHVNTDPLWSRYRDPETAGGPYYLNGLPLSLLWQSPACVLPDNFFRWDKTRRKTTKVSTLLVLRINLVSRSIRSNLSLELKFLLLFLDVFVWGVCTVHTETYPAFRLPQGPVLELEQ